MVYMKRQPGVTAANEASAKYQEAKQDVDGDLDLQGYITAASVVSVMGMGLHLSKSTRCDTSDPAVRCTQHEAEQFLIPC